MDKTQNSDGIFPDKEPATTSEFVKAMEETLEEIRTEFKLNINIKLKHEDAKLPEKTNPDDAGFDLYSVSKRLGDPRTEGAFIEYDTGVSLEIPKGHVGYIFPRSSISKKDPYFLLKNSVGVIDSTYRGTIKLRFSLPGRGGTIYDIGDKIGQLIIMPYPEISFTEVEDLSETTRGDGGFGSTGE